MYIALTDQELDALQGRDYVLTVLYMYLKRFMDYNTGIVGHQRRISYQSISEALYIEPRQGVKGGSPHISAIRRMIVQLLSSGIIRKGKAPLVFKLPMAQVESYAQNKADRKSTPQADSTKANQGNDYSYKADIPKKAKADTPHLSLNTINKPTSTKILNTVEVANVKTDGDGENLHFHKSLHADVTEAMKKMLTGFQHDQQQELLDELSWYISKKKISATPTGLLAAMVKQAKNGAFIAANAYAVKKQRDTPAPAAEPVKPEFTAEQKAANKEKGRAAMGNVRQLFNKKGAA
ncbi:hypothetical protein MCERHM31_00793 [Methylophilaceae bacterium]